MFGGLQPCQTWAPQCASLSHTAHIPSSGMPVLFTQGLCNLEPTCRCSALLRRIDRPSQPPRVLVLQSLV